MSHLFSHITPTALQIAYRERQFDKLCSELTAWVRKPSLDSFESWMDLFFTYDHTWYESLFEYHRQQPSDASRALLLFVTWSRAMNLQQSNTETSQPQYERLQETILSAHGLLSPLQANPEWLQLSYILRALLQTVAEEDFPNGWLQFVDQELSMHLNRSWRQIFHVASIFALIGMDIDEEELETNLKYFDETTQAWLEKRIEFWRYRYGYNLTEEHLNELKKGPYDSLTAIMMAKWAFAFHQPEDAYIYLNAARQNIPASQYRVWLEYARQLLQEHDPTSSWTLPLITKGVELCLPGASHLAAMRVEDPVMRLDSLERNMLRHYYPSIHEWVRIKGLEYPQARHWYEWLLQHQYSPALYEFGTLQKDEKNAIKLIRDAVDQHYPPALYYTVVKMLKRKWGFDETNEEWFLIENEEQPNVDLELILDLLEHAGQRWHQPSIDLWLQFKGADVSNEDLFTLAQLLETSYPEWTFKAFERALQIQQDDVIVKWGKKALLTDLSDENRCTVLFEIGAILALQKDPEGKTLLAEAATLGHATAMEWIADENKIYRKKTELPLEMSVVHRVKMWLGMTTKKTVKK